MEDLFGVQMDWIMYTLLVVFLPTLAVIGFLALRNRVMLRLGLRNIPRRKAQTALIVVGIMISTMIMAASLGTGDTLNFSIKRAVIDRLGSIDELVISARAGESDRFGAAAYVPVERFNALQQELSGVESIDGLAAGVVEIAPTVNERNSLSKGRMQIAGVNPDTLEGFGGFQLEGGGEARLEDLAPLEVFINPAASEELEALPGDRLTVYLHHEPVSLTVKGVVSGSGPVGAEPSLLLPLNRAQELLEHEGFINSISVSNKGGEYDGVERSDEVTGILRALFTDREVASRLKEALSRPEVLEQLKVVEQEHPLTDSEREDLILLQAELSKPELSDELISLFSDEDVRSEFLEAVAETGDDELAREVGNLVVSLSEFVVIEIKRNLLEEAEEVGNLVTNFFILFGLFSIIVGILLIFLIFVMLAAARRSELGIARAVGARRWDLIQMFVFEGTAYSLVAGVVGVGLGLLASALVVSIINSQTIVGSVDGPSEFQLIRHFEPRSVIVAYCLGMVITFITVAVSAYRVSRTNIIAAVRGLPTPQEKSDAGARQQLIRLVMAGLFLLPFQTLYNGVREFMAGRIVRGAATVVLAPLSVFSSPFVFVFTLFQILLSPFRQGWMMVVRVILSIMLVGIGLLLVWLGAQTGSAMWVRLGVTSGIIGIGLLLRSLMNASQASPETSDRVAYTFIGVLLLVYWILPFTPVHSFLGVLYGGMHMFFISGVTMVAATVLAIMYNANLLLKALPALTGRIGIMRPVLVTAVAYPLSAKFRTGLTLIMFSMVVFTMIVMSVLTEAFSTASADDASSLVGGWDISASINPTTPIAGFRQAIEDSPNLNSADFAAIGSYTYLPVQMRQQDDRDHVWESYAIRAADDGYLSGTETEFHIIADGYGTTSAEVWEALRNDPALAVADALAVPSRSDFGNRSHLPEFHLEGVHYEDESMAPIPIEVREPATGSTITLTVIAVLDESADAFGSLGSGMIAGRQQLDDASPFPVPATNYHIKVAEGVDQSQVSSNLEVAFQRNGMESAVLTEAVEESISAHRSFYRLLTGFMGLGLVVGVASLGVVSLRAVVERRQQIGVLRAIGYRRRMVLLSFLLESSFIVLLGIAIGVGLGMTISYHIVRETQDDIEIIRFTIPWVQIVAIVAAAYLFSLATTLLPARQASNIYPAEALRYA